jgi:uncharacterized membrane protein
MSALRTAGLGVLLLYIALALPYHIAVLATLGVGLGLTLVGFTLFVTHLRARARERK